MSLYSSLPSEESIRPAFTKRQETGVALKWEWHLRTLMRLRARLKHTKERPARAISKDLSAAESERRIEEEKTFESMVVALRSEESPLTEVEAALDRLQHGVYGIGEESRLPIPEAQLRATPWARMR